MKSSSFPNTVAGVIYQSGAFSVVNDGQIKKLSTNGEIDHYDGDISNHYHFICTCCNKIIDNENYQFGWHNSCIKRFFGVSKMPIVEISSSNVELNKYALKKGIKIINSTKGSLIDAYEYEIINSLYK